MNFASIILLFLVQGGPCAGCSGGPGACAPCCPDNCGGGPPPPPGLDIDMYIYLTFAIALCYGAYRIYKQLKTS